MAAQTDNVEPDEYLERAIARYPAAIASTARHALRKLRARFPGARVLVYDRRQSLPIALAAASGGAGLFSVVLYPRWVRFFILEGAALDDPERRLEGEGNQVRSIRLDGKANALDDAYVKKLISQAVQLGGADLQSGRGEVVIKSMFSPTSRQNDPNGTGKPKPKTTSALRGRKRHASEQQ